MGSGRPVRLLSRHRERWSARRRSPHVAVGIARAKQSVVRSSFVEAGGSRTRLAWLGQGRWAGWALQARVDRPFWSYEEGRRRRRGRRGLDTWRWSFSCSSIPLVAHGALRVMTRWMPSARGVSQSRVLREHGGGGSMWLPGPFDGVAPCRSWPMMLMAMRRLSLLCDPSLVSSCMRSGAPHCVASAAGPLA